jgi:hypothetical protein
MDQLIHADIFFFISTIAVVLIAIAAITALIYAIKILHNIKKITDRLANDSVSSFIAGVVAEGASKVLGNFLGNDKKATKKGGKK